MINETAKKVHQNAIDKGFFETEKNIGEMLCLIHSEVSEALEADRKGKYCKGQQLDFPTQNFGDDDFKLHYDNFIKGTFEEEIADMLIRIMDLGEFLKINIDMHVAAKMRYNSLRPKYHNKKY